MATKRRLGRAVQERRERWRRIVDQWQASGLSQAEFCRRRELAVWQLAWWRKQLAGQGQAVPLFVPLRVAQPQEQSAEAAGEPSAPLSSGQELELVWGDGRRLRFAAQIDPGRLRGIVTALDSAAALRATAALGTAAGSSGASVQASRAGQEDRPC